MNALLTKYPARTIVFILTVFAALIDLYAVLVLSETFSGYYMILFIIEIAIIWVAFQMLKNKAWALWVMTIYYAIRSINIQTDSFMFYTKNGLNIEIGIGEVLSFNIVSLFCFILLTKQLTKRKVPASNPD